MHRIILGAVCAVLSMQPVVPALANPTKFQHVIIIIQENRTPDNLFHGLNKILPDADIADSGVTSKGVRIPLKPITLATHFDMGHQHLDFVRMYDGGKMDGADLVGCGENQGKCPANPGFHYVEPSEVLPYREMAVHYGFANRMFQTNQGPSYPAHLFLFSGTSQINARSGLFVAENPTGTKVGCVAPPDQTVLTIGPGGKEEMRVYPCYEHETLADLLERPTHDPTHPIGWRYYSQNADDIWTPPNSIRHLCQPAGDPPECTAPEWANGDVVVWPPQVLVDIDHKALRQVSWVIPTAQDSDHANVNDGGGPSWVASIVNAVGKSDYWDNTVILVTWDDWGGWYDHVAPPKQRAFSYYELGFRVPLLVISPYTPAGYVSQKQHDFGSILRFVETMFDLGRIPPGNFADARADDLMDFFDFTKPPRKFSEIPATVPASHFLDRSRPMRDADDDYGSRR